MLLNWLDVFLFRPIPCAPLDWYMGVSKNNGTPKSSILIGVSIINHPFGGTPIFGNIHIYLYGCFFNGKCR